MRPEPGCRGEAPASAGKSLQTPRKTAENSQLSGRATPAPTRSEVFEPNKSFPRVPAKPLRRASRAPLCRFEQIRCWPATAIGGAGPSVHLVVAPKRRRLTGPSDRLVSSLFPINRSNGSVSDEFDLNRPLHPAPDSQLGGAGHNRTPVNSDSSDASVGMR